MTVLYQLSTVISDGCTYSYDVRFDRVYATREDAQNAILELDNIVEAFSKDRGLLAAKEKSARDALLKAGVLLRKTTEGTPLHAKRDKQWDAAVVELDAVLKDIAALHGSADQITTSQYGVDLNTLLEDVDYRHDYKSEIIENLSINEIMLVGSIPSSPSTD